MPRLLFTLGLCTVLVGCQKPDTSPATGTESSSANRGSEPPKGDAQPLPDLLKRGGVYASPKVADVVSGAGADAAGKKVVIGNVKITLAEPPANRARYDIDFRVLQPPTKDRTFRCHIRGSAGELGSVDLLPDVTPAGKDDHVSGSNLVPPELRPPFTVVVEEFDLASGRGGVPVSNTIVIR